jgi:pyrimidine operon attenuation protein/uracil phosphoribosyltransferase
VGIRKTIPASEIDAAFQKIASAIAQRHADSTDLILLGIANGGIATCSRLAGELSRKLGRPVPTGVLSVLFQRDDLGVNPIPKSAPDTEIPVDLDKATVILVDDVLFSGRTIRAALEEVFSHGRPTRVELAVLVDRGNRRLPIAADFVGFTETTTREEVVKVTLDPANPAADSVTISVPA